MSKLIDLTGRKFTRLLVVKQETTKKGRAMWSCKCECGNTVIVAGHDLLKGHTKSCGCLQRERASECSIKHGQSHTRMYKIWSNMIQRCTNPKNSRKHRYMNRGITVCQEWVGDYGVENFIKWAMQNGYADNLTIDRIDNNKGYSPDNCRWVTNKTQCNNTCRSRFITYKGKTQTLKQWAEELGINYVTLYYRIVKYNMPIEKAFLPRCER